MHIDHFEIRYDTIGSKISVSNFDTIQYVSNFQYRISTRYKIMFRISYIEYRKDRERQHTERESFV
jgi:hypothetical protein